MARALHPTVVVLVLLVVLGCRNPTGQANAPGGGVTAVHAAAAAVGTDGASTAADVLLGVHLRTSDGKFYVTQVGGGARGGERGWYECPFAAWAGRTRALTYACVCACLGRCGPECFAGC